MEYYFDDPAKQAELKRILDEWLGTPFRHHCGVKGLGCDCVHFAARVYEEMGIIKWRKNMIPAYPKDWHLHSTRELLAESILKEASVEKITDMNSLKNGDIILSHYGQAASHAAIYFDGYIYQAVSNVGVCKIHFTDKVFRRQMRFAYRIVKREE